MCSHDRNVGSESGAEPPREGSYRSWPGRSNGRGSQRRDPRYGLASQTALIPREFGGIGFVWSFA